MNKKASKQSQTQVQVEKNPVAPAELKTETASVNNDWNLSQAQKNALILTIVAVALFTYGVLKTNSAFMLGSIIIAVTGLVVLAKN